MAVEAVDAVVVGAGVVGLAVARALALAGREVVVIERETAIGTGASSRNSEVMHAGLYYPGGSLKAQLCVAGRDRLYAYCAERGVAHRRCGKLIVATDPGQLDALRALHAQARANGVHDVQWLDRDAALVLEPALHAVAALHSPSTGIVDSHGLMLALRGDAEAHGAMLAFGSPVERGRVVDGGIELDVGADTPMTLRARTVVNAAGLDAPALAGRVAGLDAVHVPRAHRCKGSYFALAGRAPFSRLVYPMHDAAGLGVHLTLDLAGQARFGPDTEWLADDAPLDYRVDPARGEAFYAAVRRYWPALPDGALAPAYSGIRPKIAGPGEPARDFEIAAPDEHGVPGLVNLFGIESPGLTACLAIADEVVARLRRSARAT
jgi:L-2-hydroxyglutarate oxidase LhgO